MKLNENQILLSDYIKLVDISIFKEFIQRDILNALDLAKEVSKIYHCVAIYSYAYSYSYVIVNNTVEIYIIKDCEGKYFLYLQDTFLNKCFKYISYIDIKNSYNKFKTPENLYHLDVDNINKWIEYYTNIYNDLKVLNEKQGDEVETFLKSIEDLPVRWNYNKTSGEIIKNGIVFTFSIEGGLLSQKIKLKYVSNNLETFLKLSDNKLIN